MALEFKPQSGNQFFDVLIDQIVNDVRQEFQQLSDSPANESSVGRPPRQTNDLVARLIDFRTRQPEREAATSSFQRALPVASSKKSGNGNKLQALAAMMGQILIGSGESVSQSPGFKDAEAEVAFQVVARYGAKFYTHDFQFGGILPEALKRERRRVLLSLHPDRQPEAQRAKAHERFLTASDAFTALADRAMAAPEDFAA
ncbi:MAG: hypothetical protein J0L82_07375 [Deltaproteobacteria bacterium]|nr:hypothetical protein [Deltaproteobacteria bacterium]